MCIRDRGPSWLALAQDFLIAKQDPGTLKVFINQNLGETWEDRSSKLSSNDLMRRMADIDLRVVPPDCLAITAGIDTQDEWLAVTLLGWGAPLQPGGPTRHWIIDWHEIRLPQRDTTHPEMWDELQAYLHTPLKTVDGRIMKIRAGCIDSRGHRSKEVRDFVLRAGLTVPVYAVQGATTRMNRPIAQSASDVDRNRKGKVIKSAYGVWNIGTEHCKNYLYGRLSADGDLPEAERIFNFPGGLPVDYFDGLLSEVYDPEKRRFIQRPGARFKRNEPIDTLGYAWAIGHHKNVLIGLRNTRDGVVSYPAYWDRLAAIYAAQASQSDQPSPANQPAVEIAAEQPIQTPQPARRVRTSDYLE